MMQPDCQKGFTLVELLVTLVVAGILYAMAFPPLSAMVASHQLSTQANDLVYALQLARSEAVRTNGMTRLECPDQCARAWRQWSIFSDTLGDGTADDIVQRGYISNKVKAGITQGFSTGKIYFSADGLTRNAAGSIQTGQIVLCKEARNLPQNVVRLRILASSVELIREAAPTPGSCEGVL